ncbi:hypothetical protein A2U01_0103901, partial [Trifolium medium]|nr:hypothetical protein [Trifolium medium]
GGLAFCHLRGAQLALARRAVHMCLGGETFGVVCATRRMFGQG